MSVSGICYRLSSVQMRGFISGIQMYAYTNEHTPEREMISVAYFQVL